MRQQHGAPARRMRHRNNGNPNANNSQGGQNRRGFQNKNRVYDSNGPDVRIRGTAFQIVEKYSALAKDAHAAGDRVMSESYLQYAEHYQRMINEWNEEFGFDTTPATNSSYDNAPAGTEPQPSVPDDDLGLPSSIIGTKAVAQRQVEEIA
jgi:hypothetical protein